MWLFKSKKQDPKIEQLLQTMIRVEAKLDRIINGRSKSSKTEPDNFQKMLAEKLDEIYKNGLTRSFDDD